MAFHKGQSSRGLAAEQSGPAMPATQSGVVNEHSTVDPPRTAHMTHMELRPYNVVLRYIV